MRYRFQFRYNLIFRPETRHRLWADSITDFNGKFTLEVDESASLVVSYIGYLAQDIPTKGKGDFHIILKEDTNTLDEVVVTGYGDFKKATYTGSASVLTTEKLEAYR